MLKNYFKIAFRNLVKSKFYSLINIMGFAVGLACCLLIFLYVQDELSYDKHHPHADRIYRVATDIQFGGHHYEIATTPAAMAEALVEDYPEVLSAGRFRMTGSWIVKVPEDATDRIFKEHSFVYSDPAILDIFSIELLLGDKSAALTEPNTLIINETLAEKYFKGENPLGRTLILDNDKNFTVTGVFKDLPSNTHFRFNIFASMATYPESKSGTWVSNNFHTYLLMAENANGKALEAKFPEMVKTHLGPQVKQIMGLDMDELEAAGSYARYYLQPVKDIHLYSDLSIEITANGDIKYVLIFSAIAVFILLIACINFMNLSTARSAKRAKEVGIRKVLGSVRKQIMGQFLSESILLAILSLLIAIGLVELFLPAFNNLSGKELTNSLISNGELILTMLVLIIIIGVFAGLYPAFFLSSFKPAQVLKGGIFKGGSGSSWMRSGLVVFQFSISIILIIGTTVIYNQLNYIRNKDLGFNKEQVVIIQDAYSLGNQLEAFKDEIFSNADITHVSSSSYLPVSSDRSDQPFYPDAGLSPDLAVSMQFWHVDHDYAPTMGMKIIEGRDFDASILSDSNAIILNQAAANKFNFDDPIGKQILTYGFQPDGNMNKDELEFYTIIGIIEDFHFSSLRENIHPLGLTLGKSTAYLSVRFKSENPQELVAHLEDKWKAFSPGQPFSYSFLDDEFDRMYRAEQRIGSISLIFTCLAIFIACLGLFGLTAFTAEQRTKEIGIRKTLGATVSNITLMLTADFLKLVLIALVVASPLAYFIMDKWLEDFVYKISIGFGTFIIAGIAAVIIAWLTVSFQSIKAASINPVKSLRSE